MTKFLNKIQSPQDLKGLSIDNLIKLSSEVREVLLNKVNSTGGHMGSNLGMVEATVALHHVFNSPVDKFVFDVSHQCYTHKILTGRKEGFINPELYTKYSGYTNPNESEHDFFSVGHTATSISLATGLAKGRDLTEGNENIIAIIGDGSLSGGEAYEGLNNAAMLNSNIIVLVNDNDMSIAPNFGGIYQNLALLRKTKGKYENNFFKTFGFEYCYIDDGHNMEELVSTFSKVKDSDHPVLIHMHTTKGKGLEKAETNKEYWHWSSPGDVDGTAKPRQNAENYNSITADFLEEKCKQDSSVIVISPATPGATGLIPKFREAVGKQFIDVGIAEEHAVAFASGIAKNGGKPVIEMFSSFIQRTYDQLSQDLALNNNPATILVFANGISGGDATHLGTFDIPLISNIPNLVYLAPTTKEEYLAMLDWSIEQNEHPVIIRVPAGGVVNSQIEVDKKYSDLNKFKIMEEGKEIAILGLGTFFGLGKKVKDAVKKEFGVNATLINPRYITGIDEALLDSLKENHQLVITLEDGILDGGFGEKIARYYGASKMRVLNFGGKKEFTDRVSMSELNQRYHLTEELIIEDIRLILNK